MMKKLIGILLYSLLFLSCQDQIKEYIPPTPLDVTGQLMVLENSLKAGDAFTVSGKIEKESKSTHTIDLVLHHALYSKVYQIKSSEELLEWEIPSADNELAGEIICRMMYRGQELDRLIIFVNPLDASDKMQSFNGPKRLFASDGDASMNVSIPHDKFENPLISPATVEYQSSFEGTIQRKADIEIENLVAYQITGSKNKKGKYLIGASSKDGFSKEQELIIGPVMPHDFTIELVSFHPFADARQYVHLKTALMKDKWGNVVSDGTIIFFVIEEAGQLVGVYQTFAIGGIANVYVENPSRQADWSISATIHDEMESNSIPLSFSKNVLDFEMDWDQENQKLSLGPVFGVLGQLVPDGTEVKITAAALGLESYVYLEAGKAVHGLAFDWKAKKPKQLEVLIGGHEKTIVIE